MTPPPAETGPPLRVWWELWLALAMIAVLIAFLWRLTPQPFPQPLPSPQPLPFDTLHPHTQQEFQRLGIAPERVTQGLGDAPTSAGIHSADGSVNHRPYCAAFDLAVADLTPEQTQVLLQRLRGAGFVCWWRLPSVSFPTTTSQGLEAGSHIHGVDPFVPHKQRLEAQIQDYLNGDNGIEVGRYAHRPDPALAYPQTRAERALLRHLRDQQRIAQAKLDKSP